MYDIKLAISNGEEQSLTQIAREAYKTYRIHADPTTKEITYREMVSKGERTFLVSFLKKINSNFSLIERKRTTQEFF